MRLTQSREELAYRHRQDLMSLLSVGGEPLTLGMSCTPKLLVGARASARFGVWKGKILKFPDRIGVLKLKRRKRRAPSPTISRGSVENGTQVVRAKAADLSRVLVRLMLLVTLNQDKSDKLERPFQVGAGELWRGRRVAADRLNSRRGSELPLKET